MPADTSSDPADAAAPTPREQRSISRWLKAAVAVLALLAVGMGANAIAVSGETKPAQPDVGRIIHVLGRDLQVREDGPRGGSPIVLIHRFAGSIHEWDPVVGALARKHRVIRIDLLGHGGSEKPSSGYSIENQARLIAAVLDALSARHALLVGHSMGGDIAVALATARRDLVDRLILIDANPEWRFFTLPAPVERTLWPIIGQLQWRLAPDSMVRKSVQRQFGPGFPVPQQSVRDVRRMTYTSYADSLEEFHRFLDIAPLNMRAARLRMPILVIWGTRDQLVKVQALNDYRSLPGASIELVAGAGHSAMIERPSQTAQLILGWQHSSCTASRQPIRCSAR